MNHREVLNIGFDYIFQKNMPRMGLMDYKARLYDPTTGSFIQPDTVGGGNRYVYTKGNPINNNDPSGHDTCDEEGNCYNRNGGKYQGLKKGLDFPVSSNKPISPEPPPSEFWRPEVKEGSNSSSVSLEGKKPIVNYGAQTPEVIIYYNDNIVTSTTVTLQQEVISVDSPSPISIGVNYFNIGNGYIDPNSITVSSEPSPLNEFSISLHIPTVNPTSVKFYANSVYQNNAIKVISRVGYEYTTHYERLTPILFVVFAIGIAYAGASGMYPVPVH